MQTSKFWKQFELTGSIEDYLRYTENEYTGNRFTDSKYVDDRCTDSERKDSERVDSKCTDSIQELTGDAGFYLGNGNCVKTDAYRGI